MFDHWRELSYAGGFVESVFPEEDVLEELHLSDPTTRNYVAKVFQELVDEFDYFLREKGIYDFFYNQHYTKAFLFKNDYVTFC